MTLASQAELYLAEPAPAASSPAGRLGLWALMPKPADLAPCPPTAGIPALVLKTLLTQRLKFFLFCRHNQGEVIWAETDREADEGLLSPGQVAHHS